MSWTRLHPLRHPAPLMAALLIAWGLGSILWGERLPRSDGFGWDGLAYLRITRGLWEPNPLIWPYSGQRCLPSVAVRCRVRTTPACTRAAALPAAAGRPATSTSPAEAATASTTVGSFELAPRGIAFHPLLAAHAFSSVSTNSVHVR